MLSLCVCLTSDLLLVFVRSTLESPCGDESNLLPCGPLGVTTHHRRPFPGRQVFWWWGREGLWLWPCLQEGDFQKVEERQTPKEKIHGWNFSWAKFRLKLSREEGGRMGGSISEGNPPHTWGSCHGAAKAGRKKENFRGKRFKQKHVNGHRAANQDLHSYYGLGHSQYLCWPLLATPEYFSPETHPNTFSITPAAALSHDQPNVFVTKSDLDVCHIIGHPTKQNLKILFPL